MDTQRKRRDTATPTQRLARGTLMLAAWAVTSFTGMAAPALAAELAFVTVAPAARTAATRYEGRVQAVRQAAVAAQVPGAVVALGVKAGDRVKAGQVLARLDARAAEQGVAASGAQTQAAAAQLEVAAREVARKRQLFARNYISQAALDQAEASWRAAQAQVNALSAQTGAARSQAGFFVLKAPFDGVVAELAVELGDMAMPGKPLMTVYDPAALRVSAAVPASALRSGAPQVRVQLAAAPAPLAQLRLQVLPTVDATSLTQEVRAELPAGTVAAPGMLAALLVESSAEAGPDAPAPHFYVPRAAVVRRAEMTGVYVLDRAGAPQLRLVRLGPVLGDQVELLSGVDAGERVAADANAASRTVQLAGGAGQ